MPPDQKRSPRDTPEDLRAEIDELRRDLKALGRGQPALTYVFGASSIGTGTTDRYLWPYGQSATADLVEQKLPVQRAGTVTGLMVYVPDEGDAAAAREVSLTLRYNGEDTPMRLEFTVPQFSGVVRATSRPFKVERDGLLSVVVRKDGSLVTSPGTCIAFVEVE